MKNVLLLFCLLVAVPSWAVEEKKTETPHYCDNAEQWAEWLTLVKKYPEDDDLRTAYALRVGLCQEIKAGTIETDRAITLFERFFDALKFSTALKQQKDKMKTRKERL